MDALLTLIDPCRNQVLIAHDFLAARRQQRNGVGGSVSEHREGQLKGLVNVLSRYVLLLSLFHEQQCIRHRSLRLCWVEYTAGPKLELFALEYSQVDKIEVRVLRQDIFREPWGALDDAASKSGVFAQRNIAKILKINN